MTNITHRFSLKLTSQYTTPETLGLILGWGATWQMQPGTEIQVFHVAKCLA